MDDGDEDQKVRDLIPGDDPRIQYVNCDMAPGTYVSDSKKINLAIKKYSEIDTPHIIVHFYDSVYYPELSVLSRVHF